MGVFLFSYEESKKFWKDGRVMYWDELDRRWTTFKHYPTYHSRVSSNKWHEDNPMKGLIPKT